MNRKTCKEFIKHLQFLPCALILFVSTSHAQEIAFATKEVKIYKSETWCAKDSHLLAKVSNPRDFFTSETIASEIKGQMKTLCPKAKSYFITVFDEQDYPYYARIHPREPSQHGEQYPKMIGRSAVNDGSYAFPKTQYFQLAPEIDKDVDQFCKMNRHLLRSKLLNYEYTKNGIIPDKKAYTDAYFQSQAVKRLFKNYDTSKTAGGRAVLNQQIESMESRIENLKGINKRVLNGELKRLRRNLKKLDKSPNSPAAINEKIAPKLEERRRAIDLISSSYIAKLDELPNSLSTLGYFESAIAWTKLAGECLRVYPASDIPALENQQIFQEVKDSHNKLEAEIEAKAAEITLRNINVLQSPLVEEIEKIPYSEQEKIYSRLRMLIGPSALRSSALGPIMSQGFRDDLENTLALANERYYELGFFQVAKAPWNNQVRPFLTKSQLTLTRQLEQEQIRLANKVVGLSPEICTTREKVIRLRSHHYAPLHLGSSEFCVPQIEVGMKVLKDEFRQINIDRSAIEASCSKELKSTFCRCIASNADGHFSKVEYDALINDPLAFIRYISIIDGMDAGDQVKGYLDGLRGLLEGNYSAVGDLATTLALSAPNHAETLARSCR